MNKKQQNLSNEIEKHQSVDWAKNIDFNKTIHLVFDTSVLEKTPYHKDYFQGALKTLRELGIIKIYIPYVVEKEYLSHINEKNKQSITCIKKALKDIKDGFLGDDKDLDKMYQLITDFSMRLEQQVQNKYQYSMIETLGAEVLDFKASHQNNVFDRYFNSKLPFNQARNKEHIPDAFIFESIKDLYHQHKNMIVLVEDKQIKKACNEYEIICLDELKTFIQHNEIQNKITSKEIEKKIEDFSIKLQDEDFHEELFDYLKQKIDLTFEAFSDSIFPEGEGEISMHDEPFDFYLNPDLISNYDNKSIGIEISFCIIARLQTNVFKSDYYTNPFGSFAEDLNEHYVTVELENDYLLRVSIEIIFHFPCPKQIKDMRELFTNIEFGEKNIEIETPFL